MVIRLQEDVPGPVVSSTAITTPDFGELGQTKLEEMGSISQSNGDKPVMGVQKLRSMLADKEKFIACPGVYDGFTARIALQEGADCLYMVRLTPMTAACHRHTNT